MGIIEDIAKKPAVLIMDLYGHDAKGGDGASLQDYSPLGRIPYDSMVRAFSDAKLLNRYDPRVQLASHEEVSRIARADAVGYRDNSGIWIAAAANGRKLTPLERMAIYMHERQPDHYAVDGVLKEVDSLIEFDPKYAALRNEVVAQAERTGLVM